MKTLIKNTVLISVILIFVSCQKDCYYEYNIINNFGITTIKLSGSSTPLNAIRIESYLTCTAQNQNIETSHAIFTKN